MEGGAAIVISPGTVIWDQTPMRGGLCACR